MQSDAQLHPHGEALDALVHASKATADEAETLDPPHLAPSIGHHHHLDAVFLLLTTIQQTCIATRIAETLNISNSKHL
jgi:hypothetical protein